MKTSDISFKISQQNRKKLWDPWQEDVSSNKRTGKLETFIKGYQVQVWGLNRP